MTEEAAIAELERIIKEHSSKEDQHALGDALISDALRKLGWNKLASRYDEAREDWWYA